MSKSLTIKEVFAEEVRRKRKERGLSQAELAKKAKITDRYLSRIERNCENITLDTVEALSGALKVPVVELLTGKQYWSDRKKHCLKMAIELIDQQIEFMD